MATKKITALSVPAAADPVGNVILPGSQDGADVNLTAARIAALAPSGAVPDSWMQVTATGVHTDSNFVTVSTFGVSGSAGSDIELDGDTTRIRILADGRYSIQLIGEWDPPSEDGLTTMAFAGVAGALGALSQCATWVPSALGAMPGGPVAFDNTTIPPLSFVAGDTFHVVAGFYTASGIGTIGVVVVVYIVRVA